MIWELHGMDSANLPWRRLVCYQAIGIIFVTFVFNASSSELYYRYTNVVSPMNTSRPVAVAKRFVIVSEEQDLRLSAFRSG